MISNLFILLFVFQTTNIGSKLGNSYTLNETKDERQPSTENTKHKDIEHGLPSFGWCGPKCMTVQFPDGKTDRITLEDAYPDDEASQCIFEGTFQGDNSASVAITGCQNDPNVFITVHSKHLKNRKVFNIKEGIVEEPANPYAKDYDNQEDESTSNRSKRNIIKDYPQEEERFKDYIEDEYDEVDYDNSVDFTPPPFLTLNIRLSFEESMKAKMGSELASQEYIKSVLVHTRQHLKHSTLGTQVELNLIGTIEFIPKRYFKPSIKHLEEAQLVKKREPWPTIYFCHTDETNRDNGVSYTRKGCDELKALAIVKHRKDVNVAAVTMSHEIGHLLGQKHDAVEDKKGSSNCAGTGIMSTRVEPAKRPVQWSSCSSSRFSRWYKRMGHACLLKPEDILIKIVEEQISTLNRTEKLRIEKSAANRLDFDQTEQEFSNVIVDCVKEKGTEMEFVSKNTSKQCNEWFEKDSLDMFFAQCQAEWISGYNRATFYEKCLKETNIGAFELKIKQQSKLLEQIAFNVERCTQQFKTGGLFCGFGMVIPPLAPVASFLGFGLTMTGSATTMGATLLGSMWTDKKTYEAREEMLIMEVDHNNLANLIGLYLKSHYYVTMTEEMGSTMSLRFLEENISRSLIEAYPAIARLPDIRKMIFKGISQSSLVNGLGATKFIPKLSILNFISNVIVKSSSSLFGMGLNKMIKSTSLKSTGKLEVPGLKVAIDVWDLVCGSDKANVHINLLAHEIRGARRTLEYNGHSIIDVYLKLFPQFEIVNKVNFVPTFECVPLNPTNPERSLEKIQVRTCDLRHAGASSKTLKLKICRKPGLMRHSNSLLHDAYLNGQSSCCTTNRFGSTSSRGSWSNDIDGNAVDHDGGDKLGQCEGFPMDGTQLQIALKKESSSAVCLDGFRFYGRRDTPIIECDTRTTCQLWSDFGQNYCEGDSYWYDWKDREVTCHPVQHTSTAKAISMKVCDKISVGSNATLQVVIQNIDKEECVTEEIEGDLIPGDYLKLSNMGECLNLAIKENNATVWILNLDTVADLCLSDVYLDVSDVNSGQTRMLQCRVDPNTPMMLSVSGNDTIGLPLTCL